MGKLSIEEKAKAYDYAVNKAKELILNENGVVRVDKPLFDELFPSKMEESEDDRIRQRIIHALHGDVLEMSEIKEAIAWLEKQKEFVSADFDDVWETADCNELTAPLEKYSKDAIK